MMRLLTFGGLALERHDGSPAPRLRPQRLAILAVLAAAGERGVSRERMSGLFWAEAQRSVKRREASRRASSIASTRERLEQNGINVHVVDMDELQKAEGAVTCCSILIPAPLLWRSSRS